MQKSSRTLAARYLPPGVAAVAVLFVMMGCDPKQDRDNIAQPPSGLAATEGVDADAPPGNTGQDSDEYQLVESATAQIKPTSVGNVQGTVTFFVGETDQEMQVSVELQGLEPGLHGFHIHEVGDCSADDASSAGGHFNPYNAPHGSPVAPEHHVGDMGNIEADGDGRVSSSELSFPGLAFSGPASILQKAVVIHSNEDDLTSQPSGDAGERLGCGVIEGNR